MTDTLRAADQPELDAPTWSSCPGCGWLLYSRRLERDLFVCHECNHHLRLGPGERINLLVDRGSFVREQIAAPAPDPLSFTDVRPYAQRLRDAAAVSGNDEAAVVGTARLGGRPVVLAAMDFGFMAGSMGVAVGRRIAHAADLARTSRTPLIVVTASGGARMQEGVLSLVQMAVTARAFGRLHEAGVLSVCVLTDPTYGGVSASFATLGSILIAERGAHVGFAGPRVVQQTIRQELPDDFQTAEFLLEHGLVDRVEDRTELRATLTRLVALHAADAPVARTVAGVPATAGPAVPVVDVDPWAGVQLARHSDRPTTSDYLRMAFDTFVELHGDRAHSDDPAIVGGIASIGGRTVVVIGHEKGHSTKELVSHNFGMPHPEGYRKAKRLLEHAERHSLPVVTLIDTPGAHPDLDAEKRGQSSAIAEIIMSSSRLRTPIVSVVLGEGGSGGALALATGDRLLVLQHSFLSVISPEGCAAILWRDATRAPQAARSLQLGAERLVTLGIATSILPEPPGGAQADPVAAAGILRAALLAELDEVCAADVDDLVEHRCDRFTGGALHG